MNRLNKIIKTGTIIMSLFLFVIHAGYAQMKAVKFVADEKNKKVDVMIDGKLFTSYIYPDDLDKPVLYPMHTSKGTVITEGFQEIHARANVSIIRTMLAYGLTMVM
jgi:hypothetical protein